MASKRKNSKIKVVMGLSNINADFLQLILCMFVSHYVIDNPLFGGALFLFANIWILYFQGNLRYIAKHRKSGTTGLIMWVLLSVSVVAGLAVAFIYPINAKCPQANYVSFFVIMLAARTVLTTMMNNAFSKPRRRNRLYKALFQILFIIPCALFAFWLMDAPSAWFIVCAYALTGFLVSYQSSSLVSLGKYVRSHANDKLGSIASYRIFSNMTLYSQIAFSLGVLMYISYVSFGYQSFTIEPYLVMTIWLLFVLISSEFFTFAVNRRGRTLSLNVFILGAVMWALGSVMIYNASGIWTSGFWTLFWGFGLACVTSVLNRYNVDFKMVAQVAGRRVSNKDLSFRSLLTQIIAVMSANVIMLCVMTVWAFLPRVANAELPGAVRRMMIQLPLLFMVISVVFALRQPLDARRRQKLMNYAAGTSRNKPTQEDLNRHLVQKDKVRFGVKIIAFFVRPFLRLKVSGKENMDQENFPSIFVCNHGIIYGPIAAVIYLPTYFRPWIDKKMVDREMAAKEMCNRHLYKIPLLSDKAKMGLARQLSRPVTWALNSFDPIPVEKNSLRNVMSTMNETVKVLSEGDNVLIFPEKPRRVKRGSKMTIEHETRTVGSLYTGFANIGTLYYEKTGKALRFYPIYANRKGHTFRIGEPVVFDPENDPREEKQRIAEILHYKMIDLKEGR